MSATAVPAFTAASLAASEAVMYPTYPGGVTVTDTQILTETETIPRFVSQPTVTNIADGTWSNPGIWSTGRVPSDGDRVMIAPNTRVLYTSESDAHLNSLEIDGSLFFSTTRNTRMIVGNATVMPTGTLSIGSTADPVRPYVKAELVIADQALDLQNDPKQYGTGLIGLGAVTMQGTTLSETWDPLAVEPHAGDTSLFLADAIPDWKPGDTLVLPDTREVLSADDRRFPAGQVSSQVEQVTIDHVQGNQVYLTAPIAFDHLGARNSAGELELLPHVALETHNVIVRSENPNGTRGHTFFTARANVDIEYVSFQDLGRTDAMRDLDSTTTDANGNVTHLGANQVGRYAVHFHHLMGPVNPQNTGYQFKFVGNSVVDSKKWAVAIHNTSYGLLQYNVIVNAQGAGFVTEDGSEIANVFDRNITINMQGTHDDGKSGVAEGDYGRGGSGFWFRRGGNIVTNNVAADSTFAGFVFDGYSAEEMVLPNYRGADLMMPGGGTTVSLNPPGTYSNLEAYGMSTYGLWSTYISGDNLLPDQPQSVFSDIRVWNAYLAGINQYHTANVVLDNILILGDQAAQNRNDAGSYGLQLSTYENLDLIVRNSRIEGVRIGIDAPRGDGSTAGRPDPTIIQNTTLRNYINIRVMPSVDEQSGNALEVRDVLFSMNTSLPPGPAPPNSIDPPANIQMRMIAGVTDVTQASTVKVYNYNQRAGDDFQVFYREQAASYVMPRTDTTVLSGLTDGLIGSPEAGLTNQQNWNKYQIAIAGGLATGAQASRPEINGLIGAIQDLSSLTPTAVLVTPWNGAQISDSGPLRIRYTVKGLLPAGASVYVTLDGKTTPVAQAAIYGMTAGQHTIRLFIGDSSGRQLPGANATSATFTMVSSAGSVKQLVESVKQSVIDARRA